MLFLPSVRWFIPSPGPAPRGAVPQGVCKRQSSVGSAPAGWWAPRGGHTPTLRVEHCRQSEGKAFGRVLPPSPQHARDHVGFHPLPAHPALAKGAWGSPRSHSPIQRRGHNCSGTGCLLETEIMIAFKANVFGEEGS